jgi:hypothetical protein
MFFTHLEHLRRQAVDMGRSHTSPPLKIKSSVIYLIKVNLGYIDEDNN